MENHENQENLRISYKNKLKSYENSTGESNKK